MFHNKNLNLPPEELAAATVKAKSQSDIILNYLQSRKGIKMTCWEINEGLNRLGHHMLITSTRRSCSDLAKFGLISHDKELVKGKYNIRNTRFYFPSGGAVQLKLM
jgi:hypothetical protein